MRADGKMASGWNAGAISHSVISGTSSNGFLLLSDSVVSTGHLGC